MVNEAALVQWVGKAGVGKTSAMFRLAACSQRPAYLLSNEYVPNSTGCLIATLGLAEFPAHIMPVKGGEGLGAAVERLKKKLTGPSLLMVDSLSGLREG